MNCTNQASVSWQELVGQKVLLNRPFVVSLDWSVKEPVTIGMGTVGTVKSKPIRGVNKHGESGVEFGVEFMGYCGLFFPPISWLVCVDSSTNLQSNHQN